MKIDITTREANVIQVAIDHLYEEHKDVLADAIRINDRGQTRDSAHILKMIEEIHTEINRALRKKELKNYVQSTV